MEQLCRALIHEPEQEPDKKLYGEAHKKGSHRIYFQCGSRLHIGKTADDPEIGVIGMTNDHTTGTHTKNGQCQFKWRMNTQIRQHRHDQ